MITLNTNIDDVVKRYRDLPAQVVDRATVSAINDSIKSGKTEVYRATVEDLPETPKAAIRRSIATRMARRKSMYGEIKQEGKPIGLQYFGARKTANGVSAKIRSERWQIQGGFQVKSKGNSWFKRTQDSRTPSRLHGGRNIRGTGKRKDPRPIYRLTGPAVTVTPERRRMRAIQAKINANFVKRLNFHITRVLKGKRVGTSSARG